MYPWNELLANLAIVAIATSLWTFGHRYVLRSIPRGKNLAFGLTMALGTWCAMTLPFQFRPGIFLDLRYTFLAIAGLFGGPLGAVLPFLVAVAKRIAVGGTGLEVGLPLIGMATASGLIAHHFARERIPSGKTILVIAIAVIFSGTAGFFVKVPTAQWSVVMPSVVLPFALLLFTSSVVACLAIGQEMKRHEATHLNRIYRAIIEALPDCLNAKDLDGRFIAANPATADLMRSGTVENLIGKTDFDFYPLETAKQFRVDEERLIERRGPVTVEQRFVRVDGVEAWLSTLKAPFLDDNGTVVGMITHNREITERKTLERQLAETQGRLSDALASMADGLAMFDADGTLVYHNSRYLQLFPLTADVRVIGNCIRSIIRAAIVRGEEMAVSGDLEDFVERSADAYLRPGDREMRLADGRWIALRTRATGEGGSLIVFSDVSGAKRTEVELRTLNDRLGMLARLDPLTGLLNRRVFDDALDTMVGASGGEGLALLMIDVDKFKAYNDTYGHPTGDTCLKQVAEAVSALMQSYPRSVVARYGGEEFAVIIPNIGGAAASAIAKLICAQVRGLQIEHIGSEKGVVTVSIGLGVLSMEGNANQTSLLRSADEALYMAKAAGRNCVWMSGEISRETPRRSTLSLS